MLFTVIIALVIIVIIITAFGTRDTTDTAFAATMSAILGFAMLLLFGAAIHANRDQDSGWATVDETTYTLAEGSKLGMANSDMEIIAVIDGEMKPITVEASTIFYQAEKTPRTVVVQTHFRDVGTAIFPWGEGDHRTVTYVR